MHQSFQSANYVSSNWAVWIRRFSCHKKNNTSPWPLASWRSTSVCLLNFGTLPLAWTCPHSSPKRYAPYTWDTSFPCRPLSFLTPEMFPAPVLQFKFRQQLGGRSGDYAVRFLLTGHRGPTLLLHIVTSMLPPFSWKGWHQLPPSTSVVSCGCARSAFSHLWSERRWGWRRTKERESDPKQTKVSQS